MATSASLVHIVDSRTPSTSGLYNAVLILVSAAFLGFTIGAAALVLSKNNKCMVREDVAEKGLVQTGMAADVLAASSEVTPTSKPGGTSASGSAQDTKLEDTKSEGEAKETPKPAETETDEKPAETETGEKPAETETGEKPVETSEDDKSETEGTPSEQTGDESEEEEGEEGEEGEDGVKAEGDSVETAEGDVVELTEGDVDPAEGDVERAEGGETEQTHEEDKLTETTQDHPEVEPTHGENQAGEHTADDPTAETIQVTKSEDSEA